MSLDAPRGAVVVLGITAVALGGVLFPAAGFGPPPGGYPPDVGPTARDATVDGTPATPRTDTPSPTRTPSPSPTPTPTATDSRTRAATPTPTTAPTASPTSTPTATAVSDREDEQGVALLLGLGVVACIAFAGVLAVGAVVTGTTNAAGGGHRGSSPPAALTVLDDAVERVVGVSPFRVAVRIPQVTAIALVGVSTTTARSLDAGGSVFTDAARGVHRIVVGSGSVTVGALAGLGNALASLPTVSLSVRSVPGLLGGLAGSSVRGGTRSPDTDARQVTDVVPRSGDEGDGDDDPGPSTVEEAWAAFTEPIPVRRSPATTPGEYARTAVDAGLPVRPVRRLTRLFREIRYGGARRSDERLHAAIEALGRIERSRADDGSGDDETDERDGGDGETDGPGDESVVDGDETDERDGIGDEPENGDGTDGDGTDGDGNDGDGNDGDDR